nr:protein-serine/threonine phosphatase [Xenococcaceae cyanobacterium MO_188.B29]
MERASKLKPSMPNSEPKIQCSNPQCSTFNIQENRFCSRCKTPIIKRYLWAIAETIESDRVGEIVGDRYLAIDKRIFLDTKPGIQPQTP